MGSFPTEYIAILAMVVVVPIVLIVLMLVKAKSSKKTGDLNINVSANCPKCSHDLTSLLQERALQTGGAQARVKCPSCQTGSTWNATGFPPVLLSSDSNSKDGISENLKKKYGQ
jgi:endogenous inhibitor of DNA gyrase (YacG/DUF329 family)